MTDPKIATNLSELIKYILGVLWKNYSKYMFEEVKKNPDLLESCPWFLLHPEKIYLYIWTTHIGIEYDGPERINQLPDDVLSVELQYSDFIQSKNNFLAEIIGFNYESNGIVFPLQQINENIKYPTSKWMDMLINLNRNFAWEDRMMVLWKAWNPMIEKWQFYRLINCFFYDEENGSLKTRHIKRLDLIPIKYDNSEEKIEKLAISLPYNQTLAINDINYRYPFPDEYKWDKLRILNRFVEFYWDKNKTEPEITSYLAKKENNFILTMNFWWKDLYPEKICKWQSEDKEDVKPDFFIENPNWYCDIIEFKLPYLKWNAVVWKTNRETFSAELNSYVAQTRSYEEYFNDPNNRKWVENEYWIKVYKPRRILVVWRRYDFPIEEWLEIKNDYRNLTILTYDDIKDWTIAQLYR